MKDSFAIRAFPAFAIGFSLAFGPAYQFSTGNASFPWALLTYFPVTGELFWGIRPGSDVVGPPMWWYGWIGNSAIVGMIFAAIALMLPVKTVEKPLATLVWVIPVVSMLYLLWVTRDWFLNSAY